MRGPADIAVVGGGLVGSALAYGLAGRGAKVVLFDPDEDDLHASAGNFGLVWVQGKGADAPHYAALTQRSAAAWDGFARGLGEETGIDVAYRKCGGVKVALDEAELRAMDDGLTRQHNLARPASLRLIDRDELADRVPAVSRQALGGLWCEEDGHADPLRTLAALRSALAAAPSVRIVRSRVEDAMPKGDGFALTAGGARFSAGRVVIAAGLGTPALGRQLELHVPVKPERGQILVTERLAPFLHVACHTVRQTGEGTVLIGDSKEDVGFDRGTTRGVARTMAARAARMFDALREARVVRQWGALRVMSPDGLPIYAQSKEHPGAMAITCHSGVTLAAAHAGEVAEAVLAGRLTERYGAFGPERFQVAA